MKISKIKIAGFKSINNPIEIELPQTCAIIGPNNTGKSNVLWAIYKVLGRDWVTVNNFDESDVYRNEPDKDIEIEIEFTEPFPYKQYVDIEPFLIPKVKFKYTRYKIGENKGQRRLEKSCLSYSNKPIYVYSKKPKKGEDPEFQMLTTIPQDMQEGIHVIYIGSDRSLKNQLPYSRNSLLATLMKDINADFENPGNKIKIKDSGDRNIEISRIDRFNQCIKEAIASLRTEEFVALEKSIKNNALNQLGFDPEINSEKLDIFFNPLSSLDFYKSLNIWVKENDFRINATELGGGFQNALVIAILKAFEERKKQGAIFLIEEPEMYLHPQMQRSLYKTIRSIGETNQVIYITHSPNFVTIPELHEIVMVSKEADCTKITQSSLKLDSRLIEKIRKELDPERNEMFFARKLLIVEGDTEKLALPEYAKRTELDFDKVGSSIIEVGGKRNIIDFVDIALSFNIPTGFVYDIDSTDFKNNEEEIKYNKVLEAYKSKGVSVWSLNNNYEDELKKFFGDDEYQEICQKFEKVSKAIRARLIAIDENINIPDFVLPIVNWLGNVSEFVEEDDGLPF